MTPERLNAAAFKMVETGGSFEMNLARAYLVADSFNQHLLSETFKHLFEKFAPLGVRTMQELFDIAATNLLTQNKKSFGACSGQSGNGCDYRGAEGTKCAVGHLIPDEVFTQDMDEGITAWNLLDNFPELENFLLAADRPRNESELFLREMQTIHDNNDIEDWPESFKRLAERLKLDASCVTNFV